MTTKKNVPKLVLLRKFYLKPVESLPADNINFLISEQ